MTWLPPAYLELDRRIREILAERMSTARPTNWTSGSAVLIAEQNGTSGLMTHTRQHDGTWIVGVRSRPRHRRRGCIGY